MIRILHLSDLHLNNKTKKEWNLFLQDSLFEKLNELKAQKEFDLIAFTGDIIDKGGEDFEGASSGFEFFEKEIVNPLLTETNLTKDRFFMVPGNHDVEREKDGERDELGSQSYLNSLDNITKYMSKESADFSGMKRIFSYKEFEKNFYKNIDSNSTNFGTSFSLEVNNRKVGVACLNSAWRCFDDQDSGRLIVGQHELAEHSKFLKENELKIALIHHPLDSLHGVEKKVITSHITKKFDLLLFGHSHSVETTMKSGFSGSIFLNMAPSGLNNLYSNHRDYSNGFTIIDVEPDGICAEYWRYNNEFQKFVLNTDAGQNGDGKFCQDYPTKKLIKLQDQTENLIEHIVSTHYSTMNEIVIGVKAEVDTMTGVKDAFILPPIDDGKSLSEDDGIEILSINEMINSNYHQIYFGGNECGKTVMLYRLVFEYVDSFDYVKKIPVYLNIDDLGNRSFNTAIREYLGCKLETVKELLDTNQIVLLIDNLGYRKYDIRIEQLKRFHKFSKENPEIKIIATSDDGYLGSAPVEFLTYCKVPFKTYFIKNLRAGEIKRLMKQWVPEDDPVEQDTRLDKLITDFRSYSLPSTAMNVSLFLWSTEYSTTKPINHAVLLDTYIEIILQKLNVENIYRDTFDFKNKSQMLACIAQEMLVVDKENYSLSYSDYIKVIEGYLDKVGFDFDSSVIGEYFIERKIFHKYRGNRIKFSYSCFFHFFLAKRMEYDSDFYEHVTHESQYHKFIKEIDYYTGLTRSNKELLSEIHGRFVEKFKGTEIIIGDLAGKWDKHFMLSQEKEKKEFIPNAQNVGIQEIKENRPSEELLEDFYNRRLSGIKNPGEILKKEGELSLESLLVMVSNVLRNSEGVEDKKLKQTIYEDIIKYSMTWMVLYREYIIEYVINNNSLPPSIPLEVSLKNVLTNMPLAMQLGMSRHLSTFKLSTIILNKIQKDLKGQSVTGSDIESFLSVTLYSDIQGKDFPKYMKKFIRKLKNTPVQDFTFFKLKDYYYRRTKVGSENEELYIDMLAEMRIKSQKLPRRLREKVIKTIKDGKKKFLSKNLN